MKRTLTFIVAVAILVSAVPAFASKVIADIEYFYADDGTLIGKAFNGKRVNFEYDLRGQLLAVKDASGKDLERYTYDPAGNRLSKTINGVTTTYTYDKANQLVTSTVNGVTTHYKYDAVGRMIQAGDKTYIYNGQNKVSEVRQNGKTIAKFEYNIDGQIAKAIYGNKVEEFIWDGLALIWRSGVTYINEPYVTGGNPVMAGDDVLFNDMLGSTLAVNGNPVEMTSFGETADKNAFFTGKPMVDELGYSFLFRDYNPNQGKWTTTDPLGYPDGWNNLAYCGNDSIHNFDFLGCLTTQEKQIHIMNQLNAVAKSNLIHNVEALALLNAILATNTNPLVQYITNTSNSISNLNSALPNGAPGKSAVNTLANYLSAGKNIAQALELANNQDPRFMSKLLDLSAAKNIPGVGSYIDFIDDAINAIAAGISQIKLDAAMTYIDQITNSTDGDLVLSRIIDSGWLVPKSTYDKYLRKIKE